MRICTRRVTKNGWADIRFYPASAVYPRSATRDAGASSQVHSAADCRAGADADDGLCGRCQGGVIRAEPIDRCAQHMTDANTTGVSKRRGSIVDPASWPSRHACCLATSFRKPIWSSVGGATQSETSKIIVRLWSYCSSPLRRASLRPRRRAAEPTAAAPTAAGRASAASQQPRSTQLNSTLACSCRHHQLGLGSACADTEHLSAPASVQLPASAPPPR